MSKEAVNFTFQKRNLRTYGGANGSKIGIVYENNNYMLKFPKSLKGLAKGSYGNNCINEYIGSHIFASLGFETQETLLGNYQDKIVVACKDFVSREERLVDFASLKNTVVDSENNGYGTELRDILHTFNYQEHFDISPDRLTSFFWEMFVVDSLLGNFDRHNGNWGFLINEKIEQVKIAPIYDCGSCLYPRVTMEESFAEALKNEEWIKERLYVFPNSAILLNGVKINIYEFLSTTDNKECLRAFSDILGRINLKNIYNIIEETPYITDLHKEFLKFIVVNRKERLLEQAFAQNENKISVIAYGSREYEIDGKDTNRLLTAHTKTEANQRMAEVGERSHPHHSIFNDSDFRKSANKEIITQKGNENQANISTSKLSLLKSQAQENSRNQESRNTDSMIPVIQSKEELLLEMNKENKERELKEEENNHNNVRRM